MKQHFHRELHEYEFLMFLTFLSKKNSLYFECTMMNIDNIEIEESIPRIKFACNASACRGACCTLPGGLGAPLLDAELAEIDAALPIVEPMLPAEHLEVIQKHGRYEGRSGSYTTMCINHCACVFVFYDDGIAKCAFERAYFENKLSWRKPISCQLFPIRVDNGWTQRLRYEQLAECNPAIDNGIDNNIYLNDFLKDALIRAYGERWYQQFKEVCEWHRSQGGKFLFNQ